ncbi:Calcium-binding EF-hand family protein [Rhynchospora pubera]|uniref:Calcium-binding EF-hand family protein n=1 Tax=Rhynchospora pubera TaxID=906938 RepID=A0AAV8E1G4_9POAL|nr:Calcium-binding EF-hand family protein [Rhynchospora pubera]
MSVETIDASTIRNFLKDERFFTKSIEERFSMIDSNHDGRLSYAEMAKELEKLRVNETHFGVAGNGLTKHELGQLYQGLFANFYHNANGLVDLEEYKSEVREMMLAIAKGLGFLPVQMVLEEGSFLKVAVERERIVKVET